MAITVKESIWKKCLFQTIENLKLHLENKIQQNRIIFRAIIPIFINWLHSCVSGQPKVCNKMLFWEHIV